MRRSRQTRCSRSSRGNAHSTSRRRWSGSTRSLPNWPSAVEAVGIDVHRCPLMVLEGRPRGGAGTARILSPTTPTTCARLGRRSPSLSATTAQRRVGRDSPNATPVFRPTRRTRRDHPERMGTGELRQAAVYAPDERPLGPVGGGSYTPVGGRGRDRGCRRSARHTGAAAWAAQSPTCLPPMRWPRGVTTVFCSADSEDVARVYPGSASAASAPPASPSPRPSRPTDPPDQPIPPPTNQPNPQLGSELHPETATWLRTTPPSRNTAPNCDVPPCGRRGGPSAGFVHDFGRCTNGIDTFRLSPATAGCLVREQFTESSARAPQPALASLEPRLLRPGHTSIGRLRSGSQRHAPSSAIDGAIGGWAAAHWLGRPVLRRRWTSTSEPRPVLALRRSKPQHPTSARN